MVSWPHVLGQNTMVVGACGRGKLFTSRQTGCRERKKVARDKIPKDLPPVTYFLQLVPPKVSLIFQNSITI